MKLIASWIYTILVMASLGGCATHDQQDGWLTLLDTAGGLDNFTRVGDANWLASEQGVEAIDRQQEYVFLVSRESFSDFILHVEFWVSDDANSGIYMRCQSPETPTDRTCYEANIFDQRPDPTYATGSIVHLAPAPSPIPVAGGRWNTYEITMQGPRLIVKLNGTTTVDVQDAQFSAGHVALQWGEGSIRFRELRIKPL